MSDEYQTRQFFEQKTLSEKLAPFSFNPHSEGCLYPIKWEKINDTTWKAHFLNKQKK